MKKKLMSLILASVICLGILTSCQQDTAPSGSVDQDTTTSQSESKVDNQSESNDAGDVNMRFMWWGGDTRHAATLAAIERYEELHTNVSIDAEYQGYDGYHQKIMTQIVGGNQPDVVQLDYIWFPDMSQHGDTFVDLSTIDYVDLSVYNQDFLAEYCSINGKVISLPMGTNGYGIIINSEVFNKHNIPLDVEFTWQSLIEEAARVNAADSNDYLFATEATSLSNFIFDQYILSNSGKHWMASDSSEVVATKDELTEVLDYINRLFNSPGIQDLGESSLFTSQMEQNPIWANDQLGFVLDWSGTLGKYGTVIGEENLAVSKPPIVEGGELLVPTKPSMVVSVSQISEHIDTATDFINWMMTDTEAIEILGTERSVPTNSQALLHLEEIGVVTPLMSQMVQIAMENPAPAPPMLSLNSEVSEIVLTILENVAYGSISPADAADKFIEDVNEKLNSLNA